MPRRKTTELSESGKPKRRRAQRAPSLPAGEDVSLEGLTFSPRSAYDAELDALQLAHARGKGRQYEDDPRVKNSLRKRAKVRGWELEFLHTRKDLGDGTFQKVLIVKLGKLAKTGQEASTPARPAETILLPEDAELERFVPAGV